MTFYQTTHQKPQRMLFYRDGLSVSENIHALAAEVEAIRAACSQLDNFYRPSITYVVARKHHHARFFPVARQDADRSGNTLPGTIVDCGITHPYEFDFYLCSHASLQGTSRPVHYVALYDENNFSADSLQTLTNNLCYLYSRCTRSVSIVSPIYYARLAAFRARFQTAEEDIQKHVAVRAPLSNVMFFV